MHDSEGHSRPREPHLTSHSSPLVNKGSNSKCPDLRKDADGPPSAGSDSVSALTSLEKAHAVLSFPLKPYNPGALTTQGSGRPCDGSAARQPPPLCRLLPLTPAR